MGNRMHCSSARWSWRCVLWLSAARLRLIAAPEPRSLRCKPAPRSRLSVLRARYRERASDKLSMNGAIT